MFCDASTWTGENHFYSARIGRTPKGPEPAATKMVLATPGSECVAQAEQEAGNQAASLQAQHAEASLSTAVRDVQDVEVPEDSEAQASREVVQHQELTEQRRQEAQSARRSLQENSKTEAIGYPTGRRTKQPSCEDHEVAVLTQTMVKAEVHVSADVQSGLGKLESAAAETELLAGAEQEARVLWDSEEACLGRTHQETAVQKAVDSSAALCTTESDLPLKTTETREGITNVQRPAEEQAVEEKECFVTKAPPDFQLEEDKKVPTPEDLGENASELEQAEEMAEVCDDRQTSNTTPSCLVGTQAALQDKEEIKASRAGEL